MDKSTSSHTMGLELEGSLFKAALLSIVKGKPKLDLVFESEINKETKTVGEPRFFSDVKPLDMAKIELKKLLDQNLVSTCLTGNQVLTRAFEIKLKKSKDIEAALPFQLEPLLPFPYETGHVDKIKLNQTADGTEFTILAAKKDSIKKHIEEWQTIQIEPEVISFESAALTTFSNHFFSSHPAHFIIYFKSDYVTCALVKNKKLIASQTWAFKNEAKDKTEQELNEVIRILYSLGKQVKTLEVQDVLVLGAGTKNQELLAKMLLKINKTIYPLEPNSDFNLSLTELEKFAVPIGLGLHTLSNETDGVNFRKDELAYPDPWKHLKKPLGIFLLLGTALAFIFYFFSLSYLALYEDNIKEEYLQLLSNMNKPYHVFESQYLAKFPSASKNESLEPSPIETLTKEDIEDRLKILNQELAAAPDLFPLFPNVPRVSDVLAWFSNHPNIVKKDPVTNEIEPLIQLESFTYSMLKKPDQTKKQEKYQVKVEFEFSTATPKLAREFHDALIAPNAVVDPKGEVKWSSNRGRYKTSFFLKDKTSYPTNRS